MTLIIKKALATTCLVLFASSCAWLGIENYDRNEKYMKAETAPRVVVPVGLDEPEFVDLMAIPAVNDSRGIAGQTADMGLPDALSTTFGIEQIVLRKLGEERWIFLDSPPAVIWPKIVQYWAANNIRAEVTNPRDGVLESEWVAGDGADAEQIFADITSGDSNSSKQHKFRLVVEPGIRSGSTEVYLTQRQTTGVTSRPNWQGDSDDGELENEILTKLAFYLGETINDPVISVVAIENRGTKAELIPDRVRPLLLYKLDFERAWATVGSALENARLEVEDLDRTGQTYFVYYSEIDEGEPGFLARFFSDDEEQQRLGNRYLVKLDDRPDSVQVSILKDESTPADALIAERLLKIIKESST